MSSDRASSSTVQRRGSEVLFTQMAVCREISIGSPNRGIGLGGLAFYFRRLVLRSRLIGNLPVIRSFSSELAMKAGYGC
jgi:hypothetical protein